MFNRNVQHTKILDVGTLKSAKVSSDQSLLLGKIKIAIKTLNNKITEKAQNSQLLLDPPIKGTISKKNRFWHYDACGITINVVMRNQYKP